jgi:hypothetical protein
MAEDEFEPARRELCPDGTCIGLIGPDGRCRVCGAVGASVVSDPRHRGMRAPGDGSEKSADLYGDLEADRDLCPDGACIGVIGPDRRCKECGTPAAEGAARQSAGPAAAPGAGPPPTSAAETDPELDPDDDDRELCPDGACVGLIGPDGRCKVCGTPRASSPS